MKRLFLLIVILLATPFLVSIAVSRQYATRTYSEITAVPNETTAVVLGASVFKDGTPSDVLTDRLLVATDLYKAGKVQQLLLTGSNQTAEYNETGSMEKFMLAQGVPASALILDQSGHRTYDSCWRAKHVFHLDRAILITQSFHLPRALLLCNTLGIDSIGLIADHPRYQFNDWVYWKLRDVFSLNLALIDLYVRHPKVVEN